MEKNGCCVDNFLNGVIHRGGVCCPQEIVGNFFVGLVVLYLLFVACIFWLFFCGIDLVGAATCRPFPYALAFN